MLESMTHNPRATRAETSDVANAVLDGSDAVMLSGETAVGSYPIKAVETMRRIIDGVENELGKGRSVLNRDPAESTIADAVTVAAVRAAEILNAAAIIAYTQSGSPRRGSPCIVPKRGSWRSPHPRQYGDAWRSTGVPFNARERGGGYRFNGEHRGENRH